MKTRQIPSKGYKYNTPAMFLVIGLTGKTFPIISVCVLCICCYYLSFIQPCPFLLNIPLFESLITSRASESPQLALTEEVNSYYSICVNCYLSYAGIIPSTKRCSTDLHTPGNNVLCVFVYRLLSGYATVHAKYHNYFAKSSFG